MDPPGKLLLVPRRVSDWSIGMQLKALLCLLALCLATSAEASGYGYYGGHRRLSEFPSSGRHMLSYYGGYGGSHRKLFSAYYGYGSGRRLQEASPMVVRPLFGNTFMPAGEIPVPQFLTRQLQGAGRALSSYYYGGSHRRLQAVGGRQLTTYYYGGHH